MLDAGGAALDAIIGVGTAVIGLQPEAAIGRGAAMAGVFVDRAEEARQFIAMVLNATGAVA